MQSNILKSIVKIFSAFEGINRLTKKMIKYGLQIFLALFLLGTVLFVTNHVNSNFSTYSEFVSTSIIKSSFTVLAEIIIGALLVDHFFSKK